MKPNELSVIKLQLSPGETLPTADAPLRWRRGSATPNSVAEKDGLYFVDITTRHGKFRVNGIRIQTGNDIRRIILQTVEGIDFAHFAKAPSSGFTSLGLDTVRRARTDCNLEDY